MDARAIISSHAQGLRSLCEINRATVIALTDSFLGGFLFSTGVSQTSSLDLITKSLIKSVVSSASTTISNAVSLFGYVVSSEMSISALGTNVNAYMSDGGSNTPSFAINAYRMADGSICRCLPLITCLAPAAIYPDRASQVVDVFTIDDNNTMTNGIKTGCYPYDSLVASTLECYYNSSCLQLFLTNLSSFKPLNSNLTSKYALDSTVLDLVRLGMTEELLFNYSTETYYTQCAPHTCTYSYTHRNTLLTTITTIIGVVGGLNTGLHFIVPILVQLLLKLQKKLACSRTTGSAVVSSVTASGKVIIGGNLFIHGGIEQ